MEESYIRKTMRMKTFFNENDPNYLHEECSQHITKLHNKMGNRIQFQKTQILDKSFSEIDIMKTEIQQLENKLKYQKTNEQIISQREVLLIDKQKLLKTIKNHSKRISKLKKQMTQLTIKEDQIRRQILQFGSALQRKKSCQILAQSIHLYNSRQQSQSTKQNRPQKECKFPSINQSILKSTRSRIINEKKDTKWVKIDNFYQQIKQLKSEQFVDILYKTAKRQHSSFRGIFTDFNISSKMLDLSKDLKIKKQLKLLAKTKTLI